MADSKKEFDKPLVLITLALVGIGVVMVYSSSTMWAETNRLSSSFLLMRQFMRVFLGVVLMLIVMRIDYHILAKRAKLLLGIAMALLVTVLIAKYIFGKYTVKGANRYLPIPFLGGVFQPSELAKLALVIYLSDVLVKRQKVMQSFWDGTFPHVIVIGLIVLPIMIQPDVGTSITIGLAATILLFVAKANFTHLLATGGVCLSFLALYVRFSDYRWKRILAYIHRDEYTDGLSYQITQSLIAFSKGGLFGVGLGHSKQKLLFLPEPFTDFIFPILGEEFGLLGTMFVLGLFLVFVWKGIQIARRAPDLFGFFLGIGITSMIGVYAFINLAVTMALIPTTGLPLPFISYGGSALLITLISTGILLNISRQGSAQESWVGTYAYRGGQIRGGLS